MCAQEQIINFAVMSGNVSRCGNKLAVALTNTNVALTCIIDYRMITLTCEHPQALGAIALALLVEAFIWLV